MNKILSCIIAFIPLIVFYIIIVAYTWMLFGFENLTYIQSLLKTTKWTGIIIGVIILIWLGIRWMFYWFSKAEEEK